ncbi:MAG TPA: DUF507 family protein [Candidatus Acidoferrales bacterium]|jgi:hypothetical protein|nr:DUF507 family protein [Candidatus Acidoferrales bacterium]
MRLSRGKVVQLSHVVTKVLVESDKVEFVEDRDTIRQKIVDILQALLKEEEQVDLEVRKKIASQKKEILEGSEEWDLLYRRYYADELKKKGVGITFER